MSIYNPNIANDLQDIVDMSALVNPFPGLRPFGIEESHLFFGREGQSDEVLMKLSENRFVSILGSSGSGKSSLMYCGLIPTLYGGFMTKAGADWKIVVTRPGGGPIDNLAEALLKRDRNIASLPEEDRLIRKTILSTVLRSSSLGLVEVIKQFRKDEYENILILVDQFEELFRYQKLAQSSEDLDESTAFVNLLLEAIHQFEQPIYVALTMRSDFIGDCAQFPDLTQAINDSHYLIPQMVRDQKRMAIEGPVAVGRGKIAPRLTQQLLNDVGDNPDQLPILQHALMRTWQFWTENRRINEAMDLRHYNAIGRLAEALSLHANEAYDQLDKRQQEICEVMFKALTERGSENQGIRRPTNLKTIAQIAGVSISEVIPVIEKFREPGRSLLMPPYGTALTADTVVDISHESLMRIWDRLKRWLDEESMAAEMYMKLSEAAERYQDGKAGLWQMPDLQLALNWREENRPSRVWGERYQPAFERTMVFLETSEKAYLTEQRNKEILQRRAVRRMRVTVIVLAVAALVSLFFVVFAGIQSQEAQKQELLALKNLDKAQKQEEIAIEQAALAKKQKAAADEARDDAQKNEDLAKKNALKAQASAIEAQKQSVAATQAKLQAEANETEAFKQSRIARDEKARAEGLRYQALARSMAIKSQNINSDEELRNLVARQAFLFFDEYRDVSREYDGDIYEGVYGAFSKTTSELGADGETVFKFNQFWGHDDAVRSVDHARDGKHIYSAGSDGKIFKWNVETRERKVVFEQPVLDVNRVVSVSPNEQYLALGTENNNILLFDLKRKQPPTQIAGHRGGTVYDLIFMPEDKGFVSTGDDRRILKSNFKKTVEILKAPSEVKDLDLSPDGRMLACGSNNGQVYLLDLEQADAKPQKIWSNDTHPIEAVAFDATGKYLAFGNYAGTIKIWDIQSGKQFGPTLTGFGGPITDVEFSKNSRLIAGASTDRTVRFWDLKNPFDLPTRLTDHNDWVAEISFDPAGEYIISACHDGLLRKFSLKPDKMASELTKYITNGNMSVTEWNQYVDEDIPFEKTVKGLPRRE